MWWQTSQWLDLTSWPTLSNWPCTKTAQCSAKFSNSLQYLKSQEVHFLNNSASADLISLPKNKSPSQALGACSEMLRNFSLLRNGELWVQSSSLEIQKHSSCGWWGYCKSWQTTKSASLKYLQLPNSTKSKHLTKILPNSGRLSVVWMIRSVAILKMHGFSLGRTLLNT